MTRLKELRKKRGFTQEQLAQALGVSKKTVSAYETGRAFPSVRVAIKLAQVLAVGLEELFKEGDNERTRVGGGPCRNGEVER